MYALVRPHAMEGEDKRTLEFAFRQPYSRFSKKPLLKGVMQEARKQTPELLLLLWFAHLHTACTWAQNDLQ